MIRTISAAHRTDTSAACLEAAIPHEYAIVFLPSTGLEDIAFFDRFNQNNSVEVEVSLDVFHAIRLWNGRMAWK